MTKKNKIRGYVYSIFPADIHLDTGEVHLTHSKIFEPVFLIVMGIYGFVCDVFSLENMFPVRIPKEEMAKLSEKDKRILNVIDEK